MKDNIHPQFTLKLIENYLDMRIFYLILGALALALSSSCVSSKVYEELRDKYETLRDENESLMSRLDNHNNTVDHRSAGLEKQLEKVNSAKSRLQMDLDALKKSYETLKNSYDALEENSSSSLSENLARNRELLAELNEKEKRLAIEAARIEEIKAALASRSARVEELEATIAVKEAQMKSLKNAISNALVNFEGKGLTVEQRDGKVYVSMENKLLFATGSWEVNVNGRQAVVELGKVLAENPEIAVLIEGHTDNVPYRSQGQGVDNNWDLSTKRATAIINILIENAEIPKENLTAAGRSEYAPIATNSTVEGKAKNRRIEVILTPKLDELNRLLSE